MCSEMLATLEKVARETAGNLGAQQPTTPLQIVGRGGLGRGLLRDGTDIFLNQEGVKACREPRYGAVEPELQSKGACAFSQGVRIRKAAGLRLTPTGNGAAFVLGDFAKATTANTGKERLLGQSVLILAFRRRFYSLPPPPKKTILTL